MFSFFHQFVHSLAVKRKRGKPRHARFAPRNANKRLVAALAIDLPLQVIRLLVLAIRVRICGADFVFQRIALFVDELGWAPEETARSWISGAGWHEGQDWAQGQKLEK